MLLEGESIPGTVTGVFELRGKQKSSKSAHAPVVHNLLKVTLPMFEDEISDFRFFFFGGGGGDYLKQSLILIKIWIQSLSFLV